MKIRILILIVASMFINIVYAQNGAKQDYTTKSKKAKKAFERAIIFFNDKNDSEAIIDLKTAIKIDSNFVEAYLLAGQIKEEQKNKDEALLYYHKAATINPNFYPKILLVIAELELQRGNYSVALENYKKYANSDNFDKNLSKVVSQGIERSNFGIYQIENPVPFNPQNIGSNINTSNDEYMNTISTDEGRIIFTRKHPKKATTQGQRETEEEDFFQAFKTNDTTWGKATRMSSLFNTSGNEGAMSISPDQSKLVFTACYRSDGFGSCDIYYSEKKGNSWTLPINMGEGINTGAWDSNPCLSADGKTLYFVSNRAGGFGSSDIWTAEKLPNGEWGNPKNMGNVINTSGAEMTPYIHQDGKTLYFASDGHLGMGQLDLFVSRKNEKGEWQTPINLGYPINDYKNQMGLSINARGNAAYMSSDISDGFGGYDIYKFALYKDVRPEEVTYMKGFVMNSESKEPIDAKFQLYDLNTNKLLVESTSDPINGDFLVVIPSETLLGLNVSKKGYLFYSEQFKINTETSSIEPFTKNIYLKPIQINQHIVLENIFFASASYELEQQSFVELQKVKELLLVNPNIKVELSGFTDNIGKTEDNIKLSELRAKAVLNYLVSIGVPSGSLSYKGYGDKNPIADNSTEDGRRKNRRTELKVVGI